MESPFYLYCLARASALPMITGTGIYESEELRIGYAGEIAAIYSRVPGDEFLGADAESNLQDLEWMTPKILRHEKVIEQVMKHSPVIPARFGSLFSSIETILDLVNGNLTQIYKALNDLENKEEWSVKGCLSKTNALDILYSERLAAHSDKLNALSPGMRHFKERQIKVEAEKELNSWVTQKCNSIAEKLIECSSQSMRRKVIPLSDEEIPTIVNWAFLVDRSRIETLIDRVNTANSEFNRQGLFFTFTGPWPPYSFSPSLSMELDQ